MKKGHEKDVFETQIKCACHCEFLQITRYYWPDEEPDHYYLTLFQRYSRDIVHWILWERIKNAFMCLFGKERSLLDMILEPDQVKQLISDLQKSLTEKESQK